MRSSVHRTIALALLLSTSTGRSAREIAPQINNTHDDYDIHIPLSAIPLGVNIGPSLEVLSFAKDAKTGELPWVARRGWLEVGDVLVSLVSLEGAYMSEFSPGEFAEAMQKILESIEIKPGHLRSDSDDYAEKFITLRVRPGRRPGRSTRNQGMYSPMTKAEADKERARWYLSYSIGPLSSGKVDVTLAAFGSEPEGCDALPVVMAIPEDGCLPLRNARKVEGAHVLVRRGGCSFLAKALTVSNSGGRSLMVVDEGAGRLRMEADQGQDVGIPVVMVSKVDGDSLATMAASTSRAAGKVTASLVVTAACLPRRAAPPQPPTSRQPSSQLERHSRRLSPAGPAPIPSRLKESNAQNEVLGAEAVRAGGVGTGQTAAKLAADKVGAEKKSGASPSSETTTRRGKRRGAAAAETAVDGTSDEARSGGVQHAVPQPCRGRSSGKLRGGDLILSSTTGSGASHISVEFLSTFVTGSLSIEEFDARSANSPTDESPGSDTPAPVVTVLSGHYTNLAQKDRTEATPGTAATSGARTVTLLPPDTDCTVEHRIRLGEQLGSAMLVVIADATDEDNITRLVSATTDIIFTSGGAVGDTASPAFNETPSSRSPPPAHGRSQTAQRVGGDTAYEKGREKGRGDSKRPGGLGQRQRLLQTGGSDEESLWRSIGGPTGGASCPPLTVIVSHGEGRRVLDWLVTVGSGVVTASVAERDDVGKLWGDVVWASDPANWPKGLKKRRRILNRLRKTHSPEHAGRGGDDDGAARRQASTTRWSLIERYARATEEVEGDSGPSPPDARSDAEL